MENAMHHQQSNGYQIGSGIVRDAGRRPILSVFSTTTKNPDTDTHSNQRDPIQSKSIPSLGSMVSDTDPMLERL